MFTCAFIQANGRSNAASAAVDFPTPRDWQLTESFIPAKHRTNAKAETARKLTLRERHQLNSHMAPEGEG